MKQEALTRQIIGAFFKVYNALGYGFLERVYQNSLAIELRRLGLTAICNLPVRVFYTGEEVGLYAPDIIVNGSVIVELKSATTLHPAHEAQLTNYLRATEIEVGLLLNFGQEPQFSRRIFTNERKKAGISAFGERICDGLNAPFHSLSPVRDWRARVSRKRCGR